MLQISKLRRPRGACGLSTPSVKYVVWSWPENHKKKKKSIRAAALSSRSGLASHALLAPAYREKKWGYEIDMMRMASSHYLSASLK